MKSNTKTFVATLNTHLVTDFIAHQAKEKPQSTALQFDQQHLTYQALNNSTNQLAHYLQDIGVQKGTMVAISVERSLEMMIGILGILKAGGVYVPIDPSYPDERIQYILQDTQANLLLTHQHLKSKFAEEVQQVIAFETDWLNILNYPTTTPFVELQKDDLAYIIYTSGSTGKPKGVMVTHENLWYSTTARLQYYTHKVRSFLLLSSFAFDSSVAGIFWTLADGGILVLPPQNAEKDPQHLANLIEKHQISHLLCLPSLHGLLLDYAPSKLASLQTVIVAGEACPKSLVSKHYQRFPNINLYNEYGPTEGSVWATVYHCSKTNIEAQTVPIGKGIAHANIYILDENREPVGIGEQGEIYIGGKGIAKGYLNRPDLTDQKFLEIQVPNQKSVRIYRTGDLGVWLSDGNIEFLGRTDHQIKLRGYRIELGEIEEAIYQLTDIQEAAVVVKGNAIDSRKLVAYATLQLQLQPNHTLTETDIKTHLNHHLPNYMIPTHVVFLKEMPRTPNGKINRKALSELPFSNVAHTSKPNHLLQNNELEGFMLQLWCKILEVENVGMKDKFFELGGNSLQAALFINELQKELQESIFIVTIFDNPTIAEYAAMLRRDYAEALERHPIFKTQIQNSSSNENEK